MTLCGRDEMAILSRQRRDDMLHGMVMRDYMSTGLIKPKPDLV